MIGPVVRRRMSVANNPPTMTLAALSSFLMKKAYMVVPTNEEEEAIPDKVLKLNIGGVAYRIQSDTLLQRPQCTLLRRFLFMSKSQRNIVCDDYDKEKDEYFFERSSQLFDPIYRYLVTGICHRPQGVCVREFISELQYWDIQGFGSDAFAKCCWPETPKQKDDDTKPVQQFEDVCLGKAREAIWNLLEEPQSSTAARLCNIFSVLVVIISNLGMILGSLPPLQVKRGDEMVPHPVLDHIEYVCMGWFTIEYLLKMLVCTEHKMVFLQSMNLIDLVAIFPFYFEIGIALLGLGANQLGDLKSALLALRILRALRIMRIFKLGKYSTGIQLFTKTIVGSLNQLGMLSLVLLTGMVFFSTLIYFLEKEDPNTKFYSIPAGFWWCIATMSSAGYGDVVPTTSAGKLVATAAVISGMLVLVLPITIVAEQYMTLAEEQESQDQEKMLDRLNEEEGTSSGNAFKRRMGAKQGMQQHSQELLKHVDSSVMATNVSV